MFSGFGMYLVSGALVLGLLRWVAHLQRGEREKPEDIFRCQLADLIAVIEPEQAEVISYVTDPLGRVPNLPFGHLHEGWSHLLSQLEPTDTLWRFKSPKRGWQDACSGYAVVRQRQVVAEFIYERHPQ